MIERAEVRIRIPPALVRAWDAFREFANVPLYTGAWIEIRCIDVLIAFVGIGFSAYYLFVGGIVAALQAAALYGFGVAAVLMFFPRTNGDEQ